MLMSFSPGSAGSGAESYVASLPFELSPGSFIQFPKNVSIRHGLSGSLKLEHLSHLYSLSLGPFSSPPEADVGLSRLRAAALWCAIEFDIGLRYPAGVQSVTLFDAAMPIPTTQPMAFIGQVTGWEATDGHYDAGLPSIRPDHKRLLRIETGKVNFTAGISIERFVAKLEEALSFSNLLQAARDDKLTLAIEVAFGHRFEVTDHARFISLVTSLEALAPDLDVSPRSAETVEAATQLMRATRDAIPREDPDWEALDRLLNRVAKLKHDSIGEAIRSFVDCALTRHSSLGESNAIRKKIREAYSTRSRLLHDGSVAPERVRTSLEFLRSFVPSLLRAIFLERVAQ